MLFDLSTVEGRIANAIYYECGARYYDIKEFCEAYGFTYDQFSQFLTDGIHTGEYYRNLDEYYDKEWGKTND